MPMAAMRPGFHSLQLYNANGKTKEEFIHAKLFLRVDIQYYDHDQAADPEEGQEQGDEDQDQVESGSEEETGDDKAEGNGNLDEADSE
jgi:hypothetical protein